MNTITFAIKKTLPLVFSYIFVGLAYGLLVVKAGFPPWFAVFTALVIYAGSMQIVLLPLLLSGVGLGSLALTACFVNARQLFYGLSFMEDFRQMGWKYPFMVLTLTDEVYSIFVGLEVPRGLDRDQVRFTISLFCYILWALCCGLGAYFGGLLPFNLEGIDFSATAFFATVVVNQYHSKKDTLPGLLGLGLSLLFWTFLGPDRFLLPSLSLLALILYSYNKGKETL